MRRDPYTIARELDRAIAELGEGLLYRPQHENAELIAHCADMVRELRRAMVRRVEPIHRTEESDNA